MSDTVRVIVTLDVPVEQAADRDDLIESIRARVQDEAGYLNSGEPVMPTAVDVAIA